MTWYRCGGGSDGGTVDISELCYFVGQAGTNVEIVWKQSLATYNDYSQYLNYNTSTRKFEVLKDFTAIITGWVRNYDRASSTYSAGKIYVNSTAKLSYQVAFLFTDVKAGQSGLFSLKTGDTIYAYTPSSNGYPQQYLKIYKLEPLLDISDAMSTASAKATVWSDEGAT